MKYFIGLSIIVLAFVLSQCQLYKSSEIVIPEKPYPNLSDYNFFKDDLANLEPQEGVLPYDLNSPLFSDYTHKARFVWMPEGTSAKYTTDHVLDFPKGAVLIKNFYYNNDETDLSQGKKIIETRLLINRGDEWEAVGYIWNEDQTDAKYEVIGAIKDLAWTDKEGVAQKVDYIVPNKNQCKNCHAYDNQQRPIGPKVRNLNKDYTYADGTMNQLEKWSQMGYLTGYISADEHPAVAVWDDAENYDLDSRAISYLDINCGHCHNPEGSANNSGLTLWAGPEHENALGLFKATVSAGAGTGGLTYSIVPGHPEESIMVYRMNSTNPEAMMPELGRRMVHQEGVQLIADWIAAMDVDTETDAADQKLN